MKLDEKAGMRMKSVKSWMRLLGVLMMAGAIISETRAATTTVDGITWTYTVRNGEASLENIYSWPVVPSSTSGDLTIPSTLDGYPVVNIGNYAFKNCNKLTGVSIGNNVTNIGGGAFEGCYGLTSMTIPDSVTSIGNYAFRECYGLTNVTIGNGMTNIGWLAFYKCNGLENILVDSTHPSYASIDGVLFSQDQTTLLLCPAGKKGAYAIPDTVTSIGGAAFYHCRGLTSVTIPNSVTSIGRHAFYGCRNLMGVTIPDGMTSIASDAFCHCSSLTNVVIPDSVTNIGAYAFYDCHNLISVTIPSRVMSIGNYAFSACTKLTAFVVGDDNAVYACRDGVLYSKDMETLVWWPGGKAGICFIPDGVKSIAAYAFSCCGLLKSVSAPDSLESIGSYAFWGCNGMETLFLPSSWKEKSLKTANIPSSCQIIYGTRGTEITLGMTWQYFIQNGAATVVMADGRGEVAIPERLGGCPVTSIAPGAFYGCEGLTGVPMLVGVTNIGNHAFCECDGLSSVAIPVGVTEIGDYAFFRCKGLTEVVIPDTIQRIGKHAFQGCTGLTEVTIGRGVEVISAYAFAKCLGLSRVTIPKNVRNIGDYAFYRCSGLADLVLPNGVERIGNFAFADCDGLTAVTISASASDLGAHPFALCNGLLEISVEAENGVYESEDGVLFSKGKAKLLGVPAGKTGSFAIPDVVTNVGAHAFDGCVGLTAFEVGAENANYASRDGVLFSKDMKRLLVCPAGKAGSFAIPDGVIRIEDRAFDDCKTLTRILIPDSVTTLGTNSLDRCNGLVALFVPAVWEDVQEGSKTLKGARLQAGVKIIHGTLKTETVDGVEWHYFAENDGSVLLPGDYGADVVIPPVLGGCSVTRIGDYAFYGCTDLESVVIPGSVTNIGNYAFYGCESLDNVTLPDSVQNIGEWAFGGCKGLKNIELPDGIANIGDRAFFDCSGLPEAAIPDSVARIGVNAFFGNSDLTALEVGANNTNYASQDGVLFSKNMEKLLWCPDGKTGEYVIPDTVKAIAYRAFGDCVGLTAGTMPESVEKIGRNSFYGCRGLAVLYVPASWEGEPGWLDMLARAKLPPECSIIYLKDNPEETTSTTPVPVPFEWLEENARELLEANGWDYEAAANAPASNEMAMWECYLVGLDPENEGGAFTAKLEFVDGKPVLKWDPDLNEDGTKQERVYQVWARKSVEAPEPDGEDTTDGWADVTGQEATWVTNGWRFFRVGVDLPK